ncbi:phosphomannomutase [Legionella beliardensis]|uniref:phosphomannomutase n=1 Tax=Legionella beliardensis TaxID=91822 RepID=A0A378HYB3_9GAMM|nr:phosphomannomutase/phosphoglucomutase [Legionella beliardensis]STX27879.1 phosphomannomutase [Legionella beliardensis]
MKYQAKKVNRAVFRAYDIRGVIDDSFDENAFYSIGRAIGCRMHALARQKIVIARDGRLTSLSLALALKQGLLDSGIDVTDLGQTPTPVMYFATHQYGIDCGVMITGSHNPADYNGTKIVLAGRTLVQADIDILYNLIANNEFVDGPGLADSLDVLPDYMARITSDITLKRRLKVVVDCGNGIAGAIIPEVIQRLGCEVIPLYCEVDGRFPNHHPDPAVEENLTDLKHVVATQQADIGLAFDGDADRLGVVTNTGKVIWPDRLMMLYARHLLKSNPGATIVYDVKCSSHLADVIEAAGGHAQMCPTGHSIVKDVMKRTQAALAGEMSGHLFFKDRWYGFDDALYSACRLLEIISESPLSVDEQFLTVPDSVNTPEIKITISEEDKFNFMQRFSELAEFNMAKIIKIDGIRVEFEHGWGLVRASNTTPCLVARFEAQDHTSLNLIQQLFKQELLRIEKTLPIPF